MDPVTLSLLGSAAFGLGWWVLGRYRPRWRDRLSEIERYCRIAFAAIEMGVRALGLKTGADKLNAYLGRAEELVRSAGLPWSQKERDHAIQLANAWALAIKPAEDPGERALRDALRELGEVADRVDAWAGKLGPAAAELGAADPPSARKGA